MANGETKVTELAEKQSLDGNDLFYAVSGGTDYKVKGSTIKDGVKPSVMTGATSSAPGTEGLVPAPAVGDNAKVFKGDGTYSTLALSELTDDSTHRVVTDTEKATWDGKSTVEANPTGTADTDLNSIKINGTKYNIPQGGGGGSTVSITPIVTEGTEIAEYEIDGTSGSLYAPITEITGEASGAVASFSDGADNKAVKSLVIGIEPVQSGSGDPSPSNIRPISGWSSVNVSVSGVNVWDEEWELGDLSSVDGSEAPASDRIRAKNYIQVKPNTSYYLKCGSINARIVEYGKNKTMVKWNDGMKDTTFTTTPNTYFIRFYMFPNYGTTYNNDISINYPSTDTSYHPYNSDGTTTTISLGQTVYGGTLNVTTGELTVDRAMATFSNTDLWTISGSNVYLTIPDGGDGEIISDILLNGTTSGKASYVSSNNRLYVWDAVNVYGVTTREECQAFFSGHQLVYELATPQTIQLTPTQITSLLGDNNIWADSGDVDVVYIRDLNLFLNQLDARVKALENA